MRREQEFLGGYEQGGVLNESDFRQGLEVVVRPELLPKAQQYDALQGFVHWAISGNRPDLALEAYDAYVVHGWTWQARVNAAERAEGQRSTEEYFTARYKKEEETGENQDGMRYFTMFDLQHIGSIGERIEDREKEGIAFRNSVLPKIINGLLEQGEVQKVYEFLSERRAIHNFRGYPRELDPKQAVDVFVLTAKALLDLPQDQPGLDPEAAFLDIVTYIQGHEFFSRKPYIFASLSEAMRERGLDDPWVSVGTKDASDALSRFNDGLFGIEDSFEALRAYFVASQGGKIPDPRLLRDWPEHAWETFNMIERNPSIPSGLALIIPAARNGKLRTSASDAFQSSPVHGANILKAIIGDETAVETLTNEAEEDSIDLPSAELSVADALRMTTNSR